MVGACGTAREEYKRTTGDGSGREWGIGRGGEAEKEQEQQDEGAEEEQEQQGGGWGSRVGYCRRRVEEVRRVVWVVEGRRVDEGIGG